MPSHYQYIAEWLTSIHEEPVEAAHQDPSGHESDSAKYQRKRKRRSDCTSDTSRRQHKATGLLDTMPTTPPPSNTEGQGRLPLRSHTSTSTEAGEEHDTFSGASSTSVSPKKKRRVDENAIAADIDRTPTAASTTSRSITSRPTMAPKSRTRGRNTSPIKSVSSLRQLQKPVHIVALGNNNKDILPEDIYNLYKNIRQRMNSGFIPAPIKEEFLRACGSDADLVTDAWFFEPKLQAGENKAKQRATLVAQLNQLVSVQLVAAESAQLGRNEPAWNCKVHQPLLDLICGDITHTQIRAENISAATITGDCVPRLWVETTAGGGGSVPACSVTATSVSSASTDESCHDDNVFQPDPFMRADSHVHSRFGSKKVDFVLVISPPEETPLRLAIDRALQGLSIRALAANEVRDVPEPSQSINPTAYAPLLRDPIAVAIETKSTTANKDPLVQLGFIVAALHRRLLTLSSPGRPLPVRLIPTIPVISVVDHNWTLYFAVDRRTRVDITGPVKMGSTESIDEIYKLFASLLHLRAWIMECFAPTIEAWLRDLHVDTLA